jgi:hypothetical protein
LECLKQAKYNKPHWLRYIRGPYRRRRRRRGRRRKRKRRKK